MKHIPTILFLLVSFVPTFTGCSDTASPESKETLTRGNIQISVDETFAPIIQQQLKVFDSSFPEAHIHPLYKSEQECIKDFLYDTTRLILVTRTLSEEELNFLSEKKVVPTSLPIAKDAVAVILHKDASDTVLTIREIQDILTGNSAKDYTVVFDRQGSSTLRFMLDSIIPGQELSKQVYAANGNDSVIGYVAQNPAAIGFVGVSYVSDFSDPEGLAFIDEVTIAEIFNDSLGKPFKPYQAYIAPDWYPLTRNLFYIHKETYPRLGTGFANFLSKERGQLIFKQSRLFPLRTNVIFREANLNP